MTRQRYHLLTLVGLMSGVLMATPVLAQDTSATPPHDGPHAPGPEGKHPIGGGMFSEADTNQDGFLTRDEMEAAHKKRLDQMFKDMDTNNDGKLSRDEMRAGREKMRQKFRERMKDRREKAPEAREQGSDKPE